MLAKPAAKPKGIMGMFGNKNAPKNEKEIKSEKKEDTPADVPAVGMFTTPSSLKDLVIQTLPTVTRTLVSSINDPFLLFNFLD